MKKRKEKEWLFTVCSGNGFYRLRREDDAFRVEALREVEAAAVDFRRRAAMVTPTSVLLLRMYS